MPLDTFTVSWSSTDPTVATVDGQGRVTAAGLGTAGIQVLSEGFETTAGVVTGLAFTQISAGDGHTCAVTPLATAFCWGDGTKGQLGQGLLESSVVPVLVDLDVPVGAVSAGREHTCALVEDHVAYCWGEGTRGQRGDGGTGVSAAPEAIADLHFTAVSAGGDHTCGVDTAGTAFCWGWNATGQLGDGSFLNRRVPAPVGGGVQFTAITAGLDHTCGVADGGQGFCWGRNDEGQLGGGFRSGPALAPVATVIVAAFQAVAAGSGLYSCGILETGRVSCWGRGDTGQLGTGTASEADSTPPFLDQTLVFTTIAPATFHACGTTIGDRTFCWGTSRLGIPGVTTNPVPLEIPLALSSVTTGDFHTCGLSPAGRAYCWGANDRGQLGDGSTTPQDEPVAVALQLGMPSTASAAVAGLGLPFARKHD